MKVLTLKKRAIALGLCVLLCVVGVVIYFTAIRPTFQPKPTYTIVIDAGHGGVDVKLGQYIKQKSISVDML